MRSLVEVAWEITDSCNYNCLHCYNPRKREDLNFDLIFNILKDLKNIGVRQIKYGGGEPLLRKDFLSILEKTISLGISTTFSTNGVLLNEEVVSDLKKLGLERVQVSLDGNQEIHNNTRGSKDAYFHAIRAICLLDKNKFKVSVATTLIKKNVNCIEELFETCSKLRVNRWRVMKYIPNSDKELMPSVSEYRKVNLKLKELRRKSKLDIFIMREFNECRSEDNQDFSCYGGKTTMSVKANGDVTPCSYFPNLIIGNLKESSAKELWNSQKMLDFATQHHGDESCAYFKNCQGGCKASSFFSAIENSIKMEIQSSEFSICPILDTSNKINRIVHNKKCDPYCWVKLL